MFCTSCTGCRSHNASSINMSSWFIILYSMRCAIGSQWSCGRLHHRPSDTCCYSDLSRPSLRSSSSSNLIVRRARRKIGDRAFSVAAPRIWSTSSYRAEDHAIDYCIQATSEIFLNFIPSMERPELHVVSDHVTHA